jgi:hypothetical protein
MANQRSSTLVWFQLGSPSCLVQTQFPSLRAHTWTLSVVNFVNVFIHRFLHILPRIENLHDRRPYGKSLRVSLSHGDCQTALQVCPLPFSTHTDLKHPPIRMPPSFLRAVASSHGPGPALTCKLLHKINVPWLNVHNHSPRKAKFGPWSASVLYEWFCCLHQEKLEAP